MKFPHRDFLAIVLLSLIPLGGVCQELEAGAKSSAAEAEATKRRAEEAKEQQEKIRQSKCIITIDVEMVQVPQKRALELLPALRSDDAKKVEAAVAQIQQLISTGEATLIGWPLVTTRSGNRAVSETIVEERYPTEYEQPTEPQNFSSGPIKHAPTQVVPNSFETHNAGASLEVEPTLMADGKHIHLLFVPQHVVLADMKSFGVGRTKNDEELNITQPIFHTQKVTGELIVTSGQPSLIGVHVLPDQNHPMEFFIARAVATKIE